MTKERKKVNFVVVTNNLGRKISYICLVRGAIPRFPIQTVTRVDNFRVLNIQREFGVCSPMQVKLSRFLALSPTSHPRGTGEQVCWWWHQSGLPEHMLWGASWNNLVDTLPFQVHWAHSVRGGFAPSKSSDIDENVWRQPRTRKNESHCMQTWIVRVNREHVRKELNLFDQDIFWPDWSEGKWMGLGLDTSGARSSRNPSDQIQELGQH